MTMDLIVFFAEGSFFFDRYKGNKRYENVKEYRRENRHFTIEFADERRRIRLPSSAVERYEEEGD